MSLRITPGCLLVLGLVGCGPAEHVVVRTLHLDPQLIGGGSPGEALDGAERLVRTFAVDGSDTAAVNLTPWQPRNAIFHPSKSGMGSGVRAAEYRPEAGVVHAAFEFGEPLRAAEFNRIELDLHSFRNGNATLTWESDERPADVPLGSLRVDAITQGGASETVVLSLVGHPAWRGTIRKLRLFPCWKGPQSYDLRAIRFLQDNFDGGVDPSSAFASPGGDSGLMGPTRDKRRTWPSDSDVPLDMQLDAQHPAAFQVEVSATDVAFGAPEQATVFVVEVRAPRHGRHQPWDEVARTSFSHEAPRPLPWRTLRVDLTPWLGQ
ncbi:MAG: hypothetical protein QF404_09270, partial [Planctomycetota bacterium]|nr:hypothetical protein [Planctomycetota bacterium]